MQIHSIQDILPLVQQPSRYLGSEINSIHKEPASVKLRVALAFPDLYEIGTSHFGLQILYHMLNQREEIAAERVFAPGADMEDYLRASGLPLFALESHDPLKRFDIIGFSLLYELNYTNVLNMLDLAGIACRTEERDGSDPLVIAGGPCTCNSEPIADFFDAIILGDGEQVPLKMMDAWLQWRAGSSGDKATLLAMWAALDGVYIPSFFDVQFDARGRQALTPRVENYRRVTRAVVADLDQVPFPERPVLPYGKPIHDRLRLEVARGCTRGCRFCQAGMIYRPVRERSSAGLLDLAVRSLHATGYEDLSLLSLSTGDYTCIASLMQQLMRRCGDHRTAVSLPSLRAGTLTPELMQYIRQVRKTGFTIAPEAGSQRLRDVINKNITEADIVQTVADAFELGWQVIKLYFMIGLPTEAEADLEAIVDLVRRLRQAGRSRGRRTQINVSVATFIPKPHTPFQWSDQISLEASRRRIAQLRKRLRMPGVQFKWQNPEMSLIEGVMARGDRRIAALLQAAHRLGCKFDGWNDRFHFDRWLDAMQQTGIDPEFYTGRIRDPEELLPWDHMDTRVSKTFLKDERRKALRGEQTSDCRFGTCKACGVCDFDRFKPRLADVCEKRSSAADAIHDPSLPEFRKMRLTYAKRGQAKFFGHLELVNIFMRALRRAGVAVQYSEGFHPMPKIVFEDALPIGIESEEEICHVVVRQDADATAMLKTLNAQLPQGLGVTDCRPAGPASGQHATGTSCYCVQLKDGEFKKEGLEQFLEASQFCVTRKNRKARIKRIDLKIMIAEMVRFDSRNLMIRLRSEGGKTIRPSECLRSIFGLTEEDIRQATVLKLRAGQGVCNQGAHHSNSTHALADGLRLSRSLTRGQGAAGHSQRLG